MSISLSFTIQLYYPVSSSLTHHGTDCQSSSGLSRPLVPGKVGTTDCPTVSPAADRRSPDVFTTNWKDERKIDRVPVPLFYPVHHSILYWGLDRYPGVASTSPRSSNTSTAISGRSVWTRKGDGRWGVVRVSRWSGPPAPGSFGLLGASDPSGPVVPEGRP